MKNPTMKRVRRKGYKPVRWCTPGVHSKWIVGWITEERQVGRRTECRVEFASDRTRWIDKTELVPIVEKKPQPQQSDEAAQA